MNVFVQMDDWTLNKAEKVFHTIQRQFGVTNYGLLAAVNLLIAGTLVAMATHGMVAGAKLPETYAVTHLVRQHPNLTVFFVVLQLCMAFWIRSFQEAEAFDRLLRKVANPYKIGWANRLARLGGCFLAQTLLIKFGISLDWLLFFLLWMFEILLACDPLPPCRGKFWERLEAAFTRAARSSVS